MEIAIVTGFSAKGDMYVKSRQFFIIKQK